MQPCYVVRVCGFQPNARLAKKLPKNTEVANILIGQVEFVTERVMALCRLQSAALMGDLTEVAIPTRFVFLSLSPANTLDDREIWHASEIARSLGVLFSDKVSDHSCRTKRINSPGHLPTGTIPPKSRWQLR